MEVRVLGPIDLVDDDGRATGVASPNQRTLLAVLVARRPHAVDLDVLAEATWGADAPRTAVQTLRSYVSRLRGALGGALATVPGGYVLDPNLVIDADAFTAHVERARREPPAAAVQQLERALAMWRGPAYGDRADLEAVRADARHLEELRASSREMLAHSLLASGRPDEAIAAAAALVTEDDLREGTWAVLVEALIAAHRPAEALRAYQRAAAVLADAGLEPSARLRAAEGAAFDGAPSVPAGRHRFRPRAVSSSLVGREDEVAAVAGLVDSARLVTLTGPGGVGKTRLALEVAARTCDRRLHGACVVDLTAVEHADEVPAVVVAGLELAADARDAIDVVPRIGTLDVLLVLDNAEHVVDAVAELVDRVLTGGTAASLLVTSREPLAIDGERVWTVAPLAVTGPGAPAARLFRDRAEAVGATAPDDVVTRVVQRLDGLPLAIEMAAAQLAVSSGHELVAELDDHLERLHTRRRQVSARHRSLSAVLEWSEARLRPAEARVLAELSVFAGPVTAADIEAVLGSDAVEIVRTLAARSLVQVDRDRSAAQFRLLQTIRSFAAQRLTAVSDDADRLAARHARHYASVARAADAALVTDDELLAVERIEAAMAELRTASTWAAEHDIETAVEIAAHLQHYAQGRFADEPLVWAERLLSRVPGTHPQRPILLAAAATRALRRGDIGDARRLATAAIALAGETRAALPALDALADAGMFDGHLAECTATARRMRDLAERLGEPHYVALGHSAAALAPAYAGDRDVDAEDAVRAIARQRLPPSARGWIEYTSGELAQRTDPDAALDHFERALEIARSVRNRYLEGVALVSSCALRSRVGDLREALGTFAEAIRHWLRLANATQQITTLRNLLVLYQRIGSVEPAAELLGALAHAPVPTYGDEARQIRDAQDWIGRQLSPDRLAASTARGAGRDVTTAATAALAVIAGELELSRPGSAG